MKFKYLGTYPHLLGDADADGAEITEWNNIKVSEVQRGKMVCIIIYQPWFSGCLGDFGASGYLLLDFDGLGGIWGVSVPNHGW